MALIIVAATEMSRKKRDLQTNPHERCGVGRVSIPGMV